MAHLDSIRKDMVILEKSEFANLRAENEVLIVLIKQLNCKTYCIIPVVHFCGTKYECKSNYGYFIRVEVFVDHNFCDHRKIYFT